MKKIFWTILTIALLVVAAWAVFSFWQTQTDQDRKMIEIEQPKQEGKNEEETFFDSGDSEDLFPESVEQQADEKEADVEVDKNDCNNECEDFSDEDELRYCQEVCGLTAQNEENKERDCADLSGNEADYCWRDQAISEKDFEKCEKISDKNIYQQCKTRIMEDIVDESSIVE